MHPFTFQMPGLTTWGQRQEPVSAQHFVAWPLKSDLLLQVYKKEPYGKECDMWSLGIIMFEARALEGLV